MNLQQAKNLYVTIIAMREMQHPEFFSMRDWIHQCMCADEEQIANIVENNIHGIPCCILGIWGSRPDLQSIVKITDNGHPNSIFKLHKFTDGNGIELSYMSSDILNHFGIDSVESENLFTSDNVGVNSRDTAIESILTFLLQKGYTEDQLI